MNEQVTTIEQAKTKVDGFINGPFIVLLSGVKALQTKTGKTLYKGKVSDSTGMMQITSFNNIQHLEGKRIRIMGKGIKLSTYNNNREMTVGDKTTLIEDGSSSAANPNLAGERNEPHYSAPVSYSQTQAPVIGDYASKLSELSRSYGLCWEASLKVVPANATEETVRTVATSFWIAMDRSGLTVPSESATEDVPY